MVIWHVTTAKKLNRYLMAGEILPPVRAWLSIDSAERFSKQTGRRVILRLRKSPEFQILEGHRGEAVVSHVPYRLDDI